MAVAVRRFETLGGGAKNPNIRYYLVTAISIQFDYACYIFFFFSLAPSLSVRLKLSRSFSNMNPGVRCVGEKGFRARRGAMIPLHPKTPIPVPALLYTFHFLRVTSDWLCSDVGVIRVKILLNDTHLRYIVVSYSVQ